MITSSSISYISQMLEQPQNITEADAESIRELNETFPYFVPARYMQAALEHKTEPFSPEMVTRMQLFSGNWLIYNEYLQNALSGEEVAFTTVAEPPKAKVTAEPEIEEETLPAEEEEEIVLAATEQEEDVTEAPEQPAKETVADDLEQEGFTVVNTGFIRGKKNEDVPVAAPEPPVAKEQEPMTEEVETKANEGINADAAQEPKAGKEKNENLIPPIYTEDYFLHQGVHVSNDLPEDIGNSDHELSMEDKEKSLMVVMSFSEWLMYYKKKKQQEQEEEEDQRELRSMWQKQRLAAALEEENEEIPENVFEMAVNSITKEDNLVSESLAEVMVKQGRYDRAIDMYKKLSLRKPQKKAYFARKIEEILKEK